MRPFFAPSAFRGAPGWRADDVVVVDQHLRLWWTSHLGWVDGRALGALGLRPSGTRQQPDGTGQTPCTAIKTITEKEQTP